MSGRVECGLHYAAAWLWTLILLLLTACLVSTTAAPINDRRQINIRAQQRQELKQQVQSLMDKCPLPGYCVRDAGLPTAAEYLTEPADLGMKQQKQKVADFIASPGFQDRVYHLRSLPDEEGILISAGKPHHLGTTAVMLHVLRHHHHCKLPVEVAYQGDSEADPVTRATLSAAFPPLYWMDLQQQQYPAHHNQHNTMDRYEPKIYALYHTRFQKVLVLDADNLPLCCPSHLFSSPHVTLHGVMMWRDLWSPNISSTTFVGHDSVYPVVGLREQPYWAVLCGGSGHVSRVAESGQLVFDRVRHADVLEYLWWITSYSSILYRHVLGDKDTFGFAFAAAGKLHEYSAVAVPPGTAFRLKQQQQQSGDAAAAGLGCPEVWRFMGMLQYDHWGRPAFFHRTFEKWMDVLSPPEHIDVVTGPLPNWFVMSYLGNRTTGLTPEIPKHTLRPSYSHHCSSSSSGDSSRSTFVDQQNNYVSIMSRSDVLSYQGCPVQAYLDYLRLRDWGLPVTKKPGLIRSCAALHAAASSSGSRLTGSSRGADASGESAMWWPLLVEQVWFRGCSKLRQQQQQQQQQQRQLATTTSSSGRGNGADDKHDVYMPNCGLIDWHVARYALFSHAEQVGRDAAGNAKPYVDARLPVLQLLPAAAATLSDNESGQQALKSQMSDHGDRAALSCHNPGFSNVLDEMQMQSLPAAMRWVKENLQGLPMLQKPHWLQ